MTLKLLTKTFRDDKPLPYWYAILIVKLAQVAVERKHCGLRRELLKQDDSLGDLLAFSGASE